MVLFLKVFFFNDLNDQDIFLYPNKSGSNMLLEAINQYLTIDHFPQNLDDLIVRIVYMVDNIFFIVYYFTTSFGSNF